MSNFGGRTKIKWRGDMLVAWFAEATPPVLWRWQASDVSAGFGLKKEDGRTELVKHEAATGSTVIAAFANEAHAQNALGQLSDAMMEGSRASASGYPSAFSRAALVWKWISSILLTLVMLYFLYVATIVLGFLKDPVGNAMKAAGTSAPGAPAAAAPSAPARVAQPQAQPNTPLGFPFAAPPASTSPMGKPVDADQLFH